MNIARTEPRIRRCFFGCNTSAGFHTYYDFLHELDNGRIFIVKGGPGTGKSHFLKEIGNSMIERGFNIEYQHCSLDPESVDAVVVPEIRVVVVAATGHHAFDPQVPGALDEILDLGMFWDEDGIRPHYKQIRDIQSAVARHFQKACRYLHAARTILDNVASFCAEAAVEIKKNKLMAKITDTLFAHCNDAGFHGSERNLFVSSITPFGTLSHLETFLSPETTIIGLVGEHGAGRSKIINHAAEIARVKGIKVEICHNPLDRNYMEHLFLPEPNLVLTTEPHEFPEQNPYIYDLNECLAPWVKEKTRELAEEKANSGYLLDKAVETLHVAKLTHERIEQFYTPNMDFSRMDNYRKSIENRILNHAAQFNPGLGR